MTEYRPDPLASGRVLAWIVAWTLALMLVYLAAVWVIWL